MNVAEGYDIPTLQIPDPQAVTFIHDHGKIDLLSKTLYTIGRSGEDIFTDYTT